MKTIAAIAVLLMFATTFLGAEIFGAEPSKPELGVKRAAMLKSKVKDFRLELSYFGQSSKPYYSLLLSVPKENLPESAPFETVQQISEEQALKIIAHLAESGALDRAIETDQPLTQPQPTYRLKITAGDLHLAEPLGFDLQTLKKLDGLRSVLEGEAAKDMDFLLGRLSGHRKVWEAAAK